MSSTFSVWVDLSTTQTDAGCYLDWSAMACPQLAPVMRLFLNILDEDYRILTAYELGTEGVMPLDNSRQFETYRGTSEADFLKAVNDAISQAVPHPLATQ